MREPSQLQRRWISSPSCGLLDLEWFTRLFDLEYLRIIASYIHVCLILMIYDDLFS
jgi:hypothetical protein